MTPTEAHAFGRPELVGAMVHDPGKCPQCDERGFRGRIALFEMLPVEEELATLIVGGCDETDILRYMRERKMSRLLDDAAEKVLAGASTFTEVMAACQT